MKQGRRPYSGPDKRTKFEHQCQFCGGWFRAKEIEIDHIEPCGALKSYDDLPRFVELLFCERGNLRKLCVECNQARKGEA